MKTKFAVVLGTAIAVMSGAALAAGQWQDVPEGVDSVSTPGDWESLADQSSFVWAPEVQGNTKVPGTFLGTEGKQTFNKTLWVSGNTAAAQATGLAVSGANGDLTNAGTIYVTSGQTTAEDGTVTGTGNAWQNKAIWAGNGATATNTGTIVAKNAYGMTVGKDGAASKLFNEGTIYVEEKGVGIELGGAAESTATNKGAIIVGANEGKDGNFTHGVLIKDQNKAIFTNYGTIDASADNATAIEVQQEKATTDGTVLNFEAGSRVLGEVHIQNGVTGTVLNANGFNGTVDLNNESGELTINVNDGANIELEDGNRSTISSAVINDGMLTASIWQNYEVEGEDGQKVTVGDNTFKSVTVNEDGIFNIKRLNSGGTATDLANDPHDQLLIKGADYTMNGGSLYVAGSNYTGKLKIGTASDKGTFTVTSGDYAFSNVIFGGHAENALNVNGGSVTVGEYNATWGQTTVTGGLLSIGTLTLENAPVGDLKVDDEGTLEITEGIKVGEGSAEYVDISGTLRTDASIAVAKDAEGAWTFQATDEMSVFNSDEATLELTGINSFTKSEYDKLAGDLDSFDVVFINGSMSDAADYDLGELTGYGAINNVITVDSEQGESTTASATLTGGVGVAALSVGSQTTTVTVKGEELLIKGTGGNIIEGVVGDVAVFEADKLILGYDASSSGNVNAETLVVDELDVMGRFTANNIDLGNGTTAQGAADGVVSGYLSATQITGEGQLEVLKGGVVNASNYGVEVTTSGDGHATLVIGAPIEETGRATIANINNAVKFQNQGDVVTTNGSVTADTFERIAGVEFDENHYTGVYLDRTVVIGAEGRLDVGTETARDANGEVGIGQHAIAVVDAAAFGVNDVIFQGATEVAFNNASQLILKNVDQIKNITIANGGTTVSIAESVLQSSETNAFLNVGLGTATDADNNQLTQIQIGFNETVTNDAELNAAAETIFTSGDRDLRQVLAAIGDTETGFGVVNADTGAETLSSKGEQATKEILAFPVTAGTYNVAYDAAEQVTGTIQRRNLEPSTGLGVWADVFYASNEAETMYGDSGYSADIYGGTIGFDGTFSCGAKLGLALSVGSGDADSEKSVGKYGNDADFWGVSIYTGKDIAGLYFSADASYLSFDNDITGSVAGASVKENIDSSVFTIGVRADMTVWDEGFKVVPHVGLRYTKIDVDDYRGLDSDSMDVFETPVGVKIAGDFEPSAGWTLTPSFDFTIVPQLGDKDVNTLIGDVDVLDNVYNSTLGVNASYGNFTFGLSYRYGFGTNDRSNNAFQARAAYAF